MPNLRRLAYRDRYVWYLTQTMTGGSSALPPLAFEDNVPLEFIVSMTGNEFNQVLSALMTGADLSYPEQAHETVWMFLRNVEFPMPIPLSGAMSEISVFANNFLINTGNAFALSAWTNHFTGVTWAQNAPANGQIVEFYRDLTPGNWDYRMSHVKTSGSGVQAFTVVDADNTTIENVSLSYYNASTLINQFFTGSFVLDVEGQCRFRFNTTSAGAGGGFRAEMTLFQAWKAL